MLNYLIHVFQLEELLAEGMIGWLIRLGVFIGFVVGIHYYLSKRQYYHLAKEIPGPPGLPVIGHALQFLTDINGLYRNVWNTPGIKDVCKLWMGPKLFVCISNPMDIELVLSSRTHIDKPVDSKLYEPWLGDAVSTAAGSRWEELRKLTAPYFHLNIIKYFVPIFNHESRALINKLQDGINEEIDSYNEISETIATMLLETVMGVNKRTAGVEKYATALRKMREITQNRQRKLWLHPDIIFNCTKYAKLQKELLSIIHSFTRQAIKTRKKEYIKNGYMLPRNVNFFEDINGNIQVDRENESKCVAGTTEDRRRMSLLDFMIDTCQNGETMTAKEIQNQIDTIMFEGHDTTALTCSHFLCVMADRPDIQEKCVEELKMIFGNPDNLVTFEDTLEMKYMERCLMETLRMYPPVPIISREIHEEIKLASTNLIIPADCTVIIDVDRLHKREDLYPNSNFFNPDNFLLKSSASRHYYSYIPFSAGPRSCMGRKYSMLNMKVLLATILRRYKVLPGKDQKDKPLQYDNKPKTSGFGIKLEPREKWK